ncbi:hypothetical protein SSX86_028188 [Deinandra increscens subsp. villosa]|uniref:Replication protein A 70 kDa DNA-binding subunit B/D first OB fold domain-containing protein n=1 Tax=Deinandra increscens subsp. villosa TaxID=3103831 RepID=A0AAP0C8X6_9ASTR
MTETISQITPTTMSFPIEIRLLHKWRPYKNGSIFSYLLIDSKGDTIQAIVTEDDDTVIESKMTIGHCYRLDGYVCARALSRMKVTPNIASIKIQKQTTIISIEDMDEIPEHYYKFTPINTIQSLPTDNEFLIDCMGRVCGIQHVDTQFYGSILKVKLQDIHGNDVVVALWEEINKSVDRQALSATNQEVIVAVLGAKVTKNHQGAMQLESTGATRVLINPEFEEANALATRYSVTSTFADDTGTTVVTIFEEAMTSIIGISSEKMVVEHGYTDPLVIPEPIHQIKGLQKTFILRKAERYDKNTLKFVVNKIFERTNTYQQSEDKTTPKKEQSTTTPPTSVIATTITSTPPKRQRINIKKELFPQEGESSTTKKPRTANKKATT